MNSATPEVPPPAPPLQARLVGIGASAGGLEALRLLVEALPHSGALCYVIAQHVSPTHASLLASLLAPLTPLRVQDLGDGQPPVPGMVYITPPNRDVALVEGRLRLSEPLALVGPKPSVNHFFESLANELGDQAIGIVLSGTGSDGALGVRAIKAAGGITIAQEPETAKYDGMPSAAIRTGNVDLILAPGSIGATLERLLSHPRELAIAGDAGPDADALSQIEATVRLNTAFRLDAYKPATVHRRIVRRMGIAGVSTLEAYVRHLHAHPEESRQLVRDLFIGVTAFFRDREAFDALAKAIGEIVRRRAAAGVIRVWVPGCSTGEEVYSIAILFEETLRAAQKPNLQYLIFASDMDEDAIEQARSAVYPLAVLDQLPKPYRDRYIEVIGDHCRVVKSVRSRVVFARQNVFDDPPFSRLDLISCRNLLIYLNPGVQKRVLEVFHYGLGSGGVLFLGKSETVERNLGLFRPVDGRRRLYERVDGPPRYSLPALPNGTRPPAEGNEDARGPATRADVLAVRTLEALSEHFAPPSLVIDADDNVIHFHGDLKPYLDFPRGRANMYLFDLVPPPLRPELRAMVYRCRKELQLVRGRPQPFRVHDVDCTLSPTVAPFEPGRGTLLLVSFPSRPREGSALAERALPPDDRESLIIAELEQELASSRNHLSIVAEELETSNEELQSLNEELQSANEELQSTNEELQTSNEELQSTNEELLTVNEELHVKSAELETTAADLINVKESLTFPLIVVDAQLRVTHTNGGVAGLVGPGVTIEGMHLGSIPWLVGIPTLSERVREVISGAVSDVSLKHAARGKVHRLRIMPYRLDRNLIVGAVLAFDDITAEVAADQGRRKAEHRFGVMTAGVRDYAITMLDPEGRVVSWNEGGRRIFGYERGEVLGKPCSFFCADVQRGGGGTADDLERATREGRYEQTGWRSRKDGTRFYADVVLSPVQDDRGEPIGFAHITRDITERRRLELQVEADREQQATLAQIMAELLANRPLRPTLDRCLERLLQLSWLADPPSGAIYLTEGDGEALQLATSGGGPVSSPARCTQGAPGPCRCELAAPGPQQGDRPPAAAYTRQCVPLRSNGVVLGLLVLHIRPDLDGDESRERFLQTAADALAGFIRRTLAEQRLRQSELHTHLAIEATGLGFWEWNVASGYIRWDDRMFELYGLAPTADGAVRYAEWAALVHPDDLPHQEAVLNQTVASRGHSEREFRIRRASDGAERILRAVETVRIGEDGAPAWVVGTNLDVTERARAEAAVRANEAQLSRVIDVLPEATLVVDADGLICRANHRAEAILGYSRDELVGRSVDTLLPPELAASHRAFRHDYALGPVVRPMGSGRDLECRRKDGSLIPVEIALAPIEIAGRHQTVASIADVTRRKAAERALENGRKRLQTVLDTASDGIHIVDLDGNLLEFSDSFARMLGYTRAEASRLRLSDWEAVIPPERLPSGLQNLLTNPKTFETRHRRKDGSELAVEISAKGIELDGQTCLYAASRDISERTLARERLERSERNLNLAQRIARLGSWELDLVAPKLTWSEEVYRIFEVDPGSYSPSFESFLDAIHPDDRQRVQETYDRSVRERTGYECEFRLLMPDGRIKHVQERCDTRYVDGRPIQSIGTVLDITDRTLAEAELRLAANVFDNTLDGILVIDPDGVIIRANRAVCRLVGYAAEELEGQPSKLLSPGTENAAFSPEMWRSLRRKGDWQGEVAIRGKNGKSTPIWIGVSSVFDAARRIERHIATIYDISDLKASQEHIHYLAHYDVLTGLPNRTLSTDRIKQALKRARRTGRMLSVMFIDLDNFKHVNDTHGHSVGDELLCAVAKRLKTITRESDTVGRLSGDEFMLLIEDAKDVGDAQAVANKIFDEFAAPISLGGKDHFVSASIGIACYPNDGGDVDTLLKHADLAMYRSKEAGRNQCHFYLQEMSDVARERMALLDDLRAAMDGQALEVHFQPVVETRGGRCVGAEALTRWRHPVRGYVPPDRFIAAAEETTLIHPLGEWVLRSACLQMRRWLDAGVNLDLIAVNVSGKQIAQTDFVALAKRIFEETGCPPERVCLELTESFVMSEDEDAIARLQGLRDLGVEIAIDDFGTGYSSLTYLKRLPVTRLKLDRSFVRDIPGDPNGLAIARAILKLAEAVEMEVVAEGVETEAQRSFLLDEGCALSQGFLYAKAIPADQFEDYVRSHN